MAAGYWRVRLVDVDAATPETVLSERRPWPRVHRPIAGLCGPGMMMHPAIVLLVTVVSILLLAYVMWGVTDGYRAFKWHVIGACAVWLMVFGAVMATT